MMDGIGCLKILIGTTLLWTAVGEEFMVCDFEDSWCEGWEVLHDEFVSFGVTDDYENQGLAPTPTGDEFLYVKHEWSTTNTGMLYFTFTIQNRSFPSNLTLAFDYFLRVQEISKVTAVKVFDAPSGKVLADFTEPTEGRWKRWSSEETVVPVKSYDTHVELEVLITIRGNDIFAMDNVKLVGLNSK